MKFTATTFTLLVSIFAATVQATVNSPSFPICNASLRLSSSTLNLTLIWLQQCSIGITSSDPNCCWGGQAGHDACLRQQGGGGCIQGTEAKNFCMNMNIPSSKCVSRLFAFCQSFHSRSVEKVFANVWQDADCCDTRTGLGKPCPKGKNRCDPESGCGY